MSGDLNILASGSIVILILPLMVVGLLYLIDQFNCRYERVSVNMVYALLHHSLLLILQKCWHNLIWQVVVLYYLEQFCRAHLLGDQLFQLHLDYVAKSF